MKRLVGAWLVLAACGRIGFERETAADAPVISGDGRAADAAPEDGNAVGCAYLASCGAGEVTCCTDMNMTRTCVQNPQACSGVTLECDVTTGQGCPAGWPCCQTGMDPATRCYDPQQPLPC